MNQARQTLEANAELSKGRDNNDGKRGLIAAQQLCTMLILSDIRFFREGLAELLRREDKFAAIGLAANIDEALAAAAHAVPRIILIDVALPDGLSVVPRLRNLSPQPQIVALALAETETAVIAWAEAGVSG